MKVPIYGERQAYHFSMTGYVIPLRGYIYLVVGFQPPPPPICILTAPRVRVTGTGIVDSGATDIYFATDAPVFNIDHAEPKVTLGTAIGQTQ